MSVVVPRLLVVAAEASGDRIAAAVLRDLPGVRAFGVGGPACARAGLDAIADAASLSAMGIADVAARAAGIAGAVARLVARVRRERPDAALLVDAPDLNHLLGRWLRRRGVRVVRAVAPQVWAWRGYRLRTAGASLDRLAVILPFEEPLWRRAGVQASYVGHPALDAPSLPRNEAREALGLHETGQAAAILPGSRPGEIARYAEVLCEAGAELARRRGLALRVLLAPGLDQVDRTRVVWAAGRRGLRVVDVPPEAGAIALLSAFDVALSASGTACLEAALAGAAPVIACRLDRAGWEIARRFVRTPHAGLPNVLLQRRAYPELHQDEVTPDRVVDAASGLLDRPPLEDARALRHLLEGARPGASFGAAIADMVRGCLA